MPSSNVHGRFPLRDGPPHEEAGCWMADDAGEFPLPALSGYDVLERPVALDHVGEIWLAQVQEWATGAFGVTLYYANEPALAIVLLYEKLDRVIEELQRVRAVDPPPPAPDEDDEERNEDHERPDA